VLGGVLKDIVARIRGSVLHVYMCVHVDIILCGWNLEAWLARMHEVQSLQCVPKGVKVGYIRGFPQVFFTYLHP
jgi:hypothetical protein